MMYGAIEAGGTKFICGISDENFKIIDFINIPTTNPEETLAKVFDFFKNYSLDALGVGSFGPINVNEESAQYGYIMQTPKKGWQNFNFLGRLKEVFSVPIAFTTDVNAACFGEYINGAGKDLNNILYLTIGTGVGGGAVVNGDLLENKFHPEMGHISIRQHSDDIFKGICPYHGNCLEGLVSGPAIKSRLGKKGNDLLEDNPYWEIEADYLAQGLFNFALTLAPERIILGGGVSKQRHLINKIYAKFKKITENYLEIPTEYDYIVPCELGDQTGILGCLYLAQKKLEKKDF